MRGFARSNINNSMNIVIQKLYKLQQIEMGPEPESPENQELIQQLRAEIPIQILGHYDRLRKANKEGVARVRNSTCMGCKMKLTTADFLAVQYGDDISICQHCARYLIYIPDDEDHPPAGATPEPIKPSAPPAPVEPIKPVTPIKKRAGKTKGARAGKSKKSSK